MSEPLYNVLFLCTGNSARSIMAEAILAQSGRKRFRAFSAGSHPAGMVNPFAIELLGRRHLSTEGLRSKSWDEFEAPGAPSLDFVFTVCDQAAAEVCPVWPGQPMTAHWGVPDPASVVGSEDERRAAFKHAFITLDRRIQLFLALPFGKLDRLKLGERLSAIGRDRLLGPKEADDRRTYNILFFSPGNSARSIMAEALLNDEGHGKFRAFSAGDRPSGSVDPIALEVLQASAIPAEGLRSKSLDEFSMPGAPPIDLVVSLADPDKGETCPPWLGQPVETRWPIAAPAAATGSPAEVRAAYSRALGGVRRQIEILMYMPRESLESMSVRSRAAQEGKP
jgi:protein-tyrosine-phosphatase